MPHEIVMPQLGLSMDSGAIIEWLKKEGEPVRPGDLLLEVESDKSTIEVEAVAAGRLHIVYGPDAGALPVGEVIGYLLAEGESAPDAQEPPATESATADRMPVAASVATAAVPDGSQADGQKGWQPRRAPSTPAARRRAQELGVDWHQAVPTGIRGQIRESDVLALAETLAQAQEGTPVAVRITPVAQRLAQAVGVDVGRLAERLQGEKRIDRAMVEDAIRQQLQQPAAPAPYTPESARPSHREPLSSLRRLIAERMSHSAHTTAPVTLTTKVRADELVDLRNSLKADREQTGQQQPAPSYNVLLAALVARALVEHPLLNVTLDEEEIIYWETVNVGIAVDTERGLVVPVLRNVQDKKVGQLAEEAQELLARASAGKGLPDDLSGATFTITNLGVYEIDAFTPIINPPETAVLGVGRLKEEFVPVAGEAEIHTMLALSLTFDHRVVDGAPAARFLQRVKQFVEKPYLWLT